MIDAAATAQAEETAPGEAEDDLAHHTTATDRAATTATPTHIPRADATRNANARIDTAGETGARTGSGTAIVAAATAVADATEDGATMTEAIDGADAISSTTAAVAEGEMAEEADVEDKATTSSRRCAARPGAGQPRLGRPRSANLPPT